VSFCGDDAPAPLRISIIIPTWRDADHLALLLPQLVAMRRIAETIVVNASRDSISERITREWGATLLKFSPPNRGAQMNAGAESANGDVLLFQHADTELTEAHLEALEIAMRNPKIIGGAFHRKFDERHPHLRWLEPVSRFLSRRGGALYGDQSVFVRREVFLRLGGFKQIPLMEDVEFSKRMRAAGEIALLDPPVETSARHHLRKGAWRTTARNVLFIVLYRAGVSPFRLHRWYYPAPELSRRARASAQGAARATAKSAAQ
jgi:rSAM/selenodomain-associated transferase 2